ncbi:hypothetical protein SapgrDRAFT_1045 [Saprospira grandis DSM 2844]|uniref:Uncharacterized protein n=1 Tax=Saprospira grandis DSM 2844 TaxID=694433 RepID=J1I259_9BACT|nr:hypothetical protein [Saprospira grandis]EJF52770.1 hypothetical protein SapgrDRAFT_1045 [Saprospira grandis DSM 2844]
MNNYLLILFFSLSFSWLARAQQDSTRSLFIYAPRLNKGDMNVSVYIDFNLEEEGLKYNSEERWVQIKQQPLFYISFIKENNSNDSIYRVYDIIPFCEEEISCKDCASFGHSLAWVFADKKFYFDLEWASEKEKEYHIYEHGGHIVSRFTFKLKLSEELPWPFRPEKE